MHWAQKTIEQILIAAGIPTVTRNTYLYINERGGIAHMELPPSWHAVPADEHESIGYAVSMMRA